MDHSASSSSTTVIPSDQVPIKMAEMVVPSQLKFLMGNIKSAMNIHLTSENYPLWCSQLMKRFTTNGFDRYLDRTTIKPPKQIVGDNGYIIPNPHYNMWILIDQNLAVALYSTISSNLLFYVLNIDTCSDIW